MDKKVIINELTYTAIRSSGAGGQHVNKVATKVVASFNIIGSIGLSDSEKELLLENLSSRLTKDNVLIIACAESRSQFRNKAIVTDRVIQLLTENLIRPSIRRKTKPSRSSVLRNLKNKKIQSEKKNLRKKPRL